MRGNFLQKKGNVIKSLGNNLFLIELENKKRIHATVASIFRKNNIRERKIKVNEKAVKVLISMDDSNKGFIIDYYK